MTGNRLYSARQTRELDRVAIDEFAMPGYQLMERAGGATYRHLRKKWPDRHSLTVLCGPGNNGGDGYVIARLAAQDGLAQRVYAPAGEPRPGSDAERAWQDYLAAGGEVFSDLPVDQESPASAASELVVDALLGTGLDRHVEGLLARAIDWINRQPTPRVAVDVPSGLNADTGMAMGSTVHADATVSFIGRKQGLYTGVAANYRGELVFDDLGVPAEAYARVPHAAELLLLESLLAQLPRRWPADHKGHAGHVLVVGGNLGMAGAIRLAGEAAARSGAGLTSVATLPQHVAAVVSNRPELMVHGITGPDALQTLCARASVIAIGPGLAGDRWGRELLSCVLEQPQPLVLDADALNLLAQEPVQRGNWVLTPHPGEAARLLGVSVEKVNQDRFAAVAELQQRFGGVCVLKGAGSLVAGTKRLSVCPYGNAGMASGGMGDVLTGIVSGLLAQGVDLSEAAELAVCLHGKAADLVASRQGQRGMLAGDLLGEIPALLNFIYTQGQ